MVDAVPGFAPSWQHIKSDPMHMDDDGGRLFYLDAAEFARYVVSALAGGQAAEVSAAFEAIERLHVEGDAVVRELATIGFLEDIQQWAQRGGFQPRDLETYLGPESVKWWRGLEACWSGEQKGGVSPVE